MTFRGTVVPVAYDGFLALIRSSLDAAGMTSEHVGVYDGEGRDQLRKCVIVGDVDSGDREQVWAQMGASPRHRDQRFVINFDVYVDIPGDTVKEARDAAYAIYRVIEQACRENVTLALSDSGIMWVELIQEAYEANGDDEGQHAHLECGLAVKARI